MASYIRNLLNRFIFRKPRDRRLYFRKPLSLKVTNQQSGMFSYYTSKDISAGGMFLKAEEPPPVGTKLHLEFTLPPGSSPIRTSAVVVRVVVHSQGRDVTTGMGIRFTDLKKKDREHIEKFVVEPY